MLKDFKEFAFKGNLVDMAVGIIIGGAFATVVKSLVGDVIMPAVGAVIGDVDFTKFKTVLTEGTAAVEEVKTDGVVTTEAVAGIEEVAIKYGAFLTELISFIILAFVVFILVKKVMSAMKKDEAEEPEEAPKQEVLLEEIRDALKK